LWKSEKIFCGFSCGLLAVLPLTEEEKKNAFSKMNF